MAAPADIRVELLEVLEEAYSLRIHNCDHGVLEALVDHLHHDAAVAYVSINWVHPLQVTSALLLRLTPEAVGKTTMQSLLVDTLNAMLQLTFKDAYTCTESDACEAPGGRTLRAELTLPGVYLSWANAVRRFLLGRIPALAIDELTIRSNVSMYSDEVLAHRVGQIPVRFRDGEPPPVHFENAFFKLSVYVPEDAPQSVTRVSSSMLESTSPHVKLAFSADTATDVTLCHLAPGQSVEFMGKLATGTGVMHTKFAAVSLVGRRTPPDAAGDVPQTVTLPFTTCGQMLPQACVTSAMEQLNLSLQGVRDAVLQLGGGLK